MATHKHLIRQWIEANPQEIHTRITLDALTDLGAEELAPPGAFDGHTYGDIPTFKPARTTLVLADKLLPFVQDRPKPKPKAKAEAEDKPVKVAPKKADKVDDE